MNRQDYLRAFQRRRDAKRIGALSSEVSRLRHKLLDMEREVFDTRSERMGETIYEMALNQQGLRIADLEAQVSRLQWAFTEAHGYVDEEGFFLHDHPYHERWGLEPGDLDPTTDTPEMSG